MENDNYEGSKSIELDNRIRETGILSGKKQVEFAAMMGIQPPHLNRWIQGESTFNEINLLLYFEKFPYRNFLGI
jgi:transcriptional regulator with XRE-family HTH domain